LLQGGLIAGSHQTKHFVFAGQHVRSELKPAFKKYVIEEGEGIVFDQERETDMVVHLLQFKQKVSKPYSCFKAVLLPARIKPSTSFSLVNMSVRCVTYSRVEACI
jgi:hypothetical protein